VYTGAGTEEHEGEGEEAAVESSVIKRKVNVLLLAIPLVATHLLHLHLLLPYHEQLAALLGEERIEPAINLGVFVLSAASLIPLAGFVESAVEELAELLGPFVGGLLHTTFGNVAELTIGLSVLLSFAQNGGAQIVLGSIAGVIIRNSLLFLGLSTLLGCWRNGHMKFDAENASEYSTVFALAVIGLSLPTIGRLVFGGSIDEPLSLFQRHRLDLLSGALALVLLVSYLAYLGFAVFRFGEGYNLVEQRTQRRAQRLRLKQESRERRQQARRGVVLPVTPDTQALFREEREQAEQRLAATGAAYAAAPVTVAIATSARAEERESTARARRYARAGVLEERRKAREARGELGLLAGHRVLRGIAAAVVLAVATAGVASMSEAFAQSVERLLADNPQFHPYEFFLGLILIPVLAGLVELYGSVETARNNRMEITMAVTAGASIQMVLLVVPILVLTGLATNHHLMLVFTPLDIIVFGASTFIFMLLGRDGESTWLEGVQLVTLWLLVAVIAIFLYPKLPPL
jgi:Ca2+:H+ antiporter